MNNKKLKDLMADALGITKQEQEVLDAGSSHNYNCRCDTCLQWWIEVGPDGGEPGEYGPFSRDEVIARATELGKPTSYLL